MTLLMMGQHEQLPTCGYEELEVKSILPANITYIYMSAFYLVVKQICDLGLDFVDVTSQVLGVGITPRTPLLPPPPSPSKSSKREGIMSKEKE